MLQISEIRKKKNEIIKKLQIRDFDASTFFDELLNKDNNRRKTQKELDGLLKKINQFSKQIGELYNTGKVDKANILKIECTTIKKRVKILQDEYAKAEKNIQDILVQIPNVPHKSVPKGNCETDNKVIRKSEKNLKLIDNAKPHWELANNYNLIDFELGNKITGSGFPVYIDKGAKLQRALISYFLDKNTEVGYTEYIPPNLVNEASGFGTGQLPDKEGQMYYVSEDNLYLIPTAEVPVTNLFRDVILQKNDLPIKCTAYTPCFRREAGSYGKDVRGLNRLHQFDKVEIVQIQSPENSYDTLENMVSHVANILDNLNLPYRITQLCGGDLGFTSSLTYDFEVYSAGQDKWLEVSSVSNFESYQANRLKLRFKDQNGKINLCHTLNGSALALPRIFAALIENNQTKKGITIPKVLQSYTGFELLN